MTETLFCYSCRTHHLRELMHQFHTQHGLRWRCRRTIDAAKCGTTERDAFGRQQTDINRQFAQEMADKLFVPFTARRLQR
jgi:hypothetical protein